MTRYGALRERILGVFPSLEESAVRNGATETRQRLSDAELRLREGTLKVVVCGEFNRGKSSLLNALLDLYPGLLPEGAQIVTSLVTTVSYGPELLVTVTLEDELGELVAHGIAPGELAQYVSEDANRENARRVRGVDIQLDNENLEAGLVLIDTPGIRGIYDGHWLVTRAVLEEADAIVFVTDATEPLSDGEVEFLRAEAERVQVIDDETGLLIVVTKKDLNKDYAEAVAEVRARLGAALGRPAGQLSVIAVSSLAKQRYLHRRNPAQLERSNFEELEGLIWSALTRRQAKVLLSSALEELRRSAESMRAPAEETIGALDSPSPAATSERAATIQARLNHFDRQAAPDAAWRGDLAGGFAEATGDVKAKGAAALDESHRRLIAKLGDVVDEPDQVGYEIANEILGVVSAANYQLAMRAAKLQRTLEERTGLAVSGSSIGHLAAPPAADLRVRRKREAKEIKNEKVIAGVGEGIGVAGGRLVGWALIPIMGPAALPAGEAAGGGLAFLITTAVSAFRHYKERAAQHADKAARMHDLEIDIAAHYLQIRTHLYREIDRKSREFSDRIGRELESLIRQELASGTMSLSQVRGRAPLDADSAAALRRQMSGELTFLDQILDEIGALEQAVLELEGGAA
jgi:GTPase SAR1 family protein